MWKLRSAGAAFSDRLKLSGRFVRRMNVPAFARFDIIQPLPLLIPLRLRSVRQQRWRRQQWRARACSVPEEAYERKKPNEGYLSIFFIDSFSGWFS